MFNIKGTVKGYIYDCCEKYAKKKNMSIDDVQLILSLDVQLSGRDTLAVSNSYVLCEKYVKKEQYTFLQVLDVTIDFLGRQILAEPFIRKALVRFSQEHDIEIEKVSVMCVPFRNDKKKKDISLFLYNGDDYVSTTFKDASGEVIDGLSFDDLFREEDFELPTMQ